MNAISGEPKKYGIEAYLQRQGEKKKAKYIQDYVIVPGQLWLDGIAVSPGEVRQFVAKPLGDGLTVEGQVTGSENVGGMQFEIIRTEQKVISDRWVLRSS